MKRFIVTGRPRSGTAYAAELFRALGVRIEHEKVFGIAQAAGDLPVDWRDADAVVLHQVRHPLEFTRSIVGIAFLSDHRREKPFPTVVGNHVPEIYEPAREADRAALLWRAWNTQAEAHADITYRLEDLDVALLMRLAELVELDVTTDQAARALDSIPRNVNQRNRNTTVPWARIAPITADLAAHYGYEAPVADRAG